VAGVVLGVVAAVFWGVSGAVAGRAARALGAQSALAWAYVVGLTAALPAAVATGIPHPDARSLGWTAVAAPAAVASLYAMYAALRRGPAVLVLPLVASQGGVAALVAVAFGEHLQTAAAAGLAVAMLGMYAVIRPPSAARRSVPHPTAAIGFAVVCAAISGFALYGSARAADGLGALWLLAILRGSGVLAITVPAALRGVLRRPGGALRLVVFCGLADTAGFTSYVIAADRGGVAVPAVISSQFAAVSVLIGVVLMGERLSRLQLGGVAGILAGVAVVTAVQS
jgi:drug/metabolite transporter (DMT)-like permease